VDVHSKLGEWTRFDLYFPAEEEYSAPAPKPVEHTQVKPNEVTLLLVDDEDYVLNVLGDILEFLGYHVVKKNSGKEALKYYQDHQQAINYVIIDMKMPDWDGKTTLKELRKVNPNVKAILTSGIDEGPIDHSNLNGVLGFLRKPYSINQVSKSMEEILSK
jgi:DNA-binding NtrC family response regulator